MFVPQWKIRDFCVILVGRLLKAVPLDLMSSQLCCITGAYMQLY
jgi:hypothetical protein